MVWSIGDVYLNVSQKRVRIRFMRNTEKTSAPFGGSDEISHGTQTEIQAGGGSGGIDGETDNGFIWPPGVGDPGSGG